MSTVAPLAALTAVLPVGVAVGAGERVAALEAGGMVLAVIGSAVTAGEPQSRRLVRGAGYGLAAATAFGVFLLGLGEASEAGGPAAVLCGRLASLPALALVLAWRRPGARRAGTTPRSWRRSARSTCWRTWPTRARPAATPARPSRCWPPCIRSRPCSWPARCCASGSAARAMGGVGAVLGGIALISLAGGGGSTSGRRFGSVFECGERLARARRARAD